MEEFMENFSKELPEECINHRKQFEACKISEDPEFSENLDKPLARTKGCRGEYFKYDLCVKNFNERYMKLKNLVAEIEGEQLPYDIEKERNFQKFNLTKFNMGLDKF